MENPMIEGKKRPEFLTVLCVLTFINSAFWLLMYTIFSFMGNPVFVEKMTELMEEQGREMPEAFTSMMGHATAIGSINIVLTIISLVGAIMMFKLNRTGFYLYSLAQVLMIFVVPFFMGMETFSYTSLILPVVWIAMYGANLKHMNKCGCATCGSAGE